MLAPVLVLASVLGLESFESEEEDICDEEPVDRILDRVSTLNSQNRRVSDATGDSRLIALIAFSGDSLDKT